jgi:RNase P/RNase MRP subunit POP5
MAWDNLFHKVRPRWAYVSLQIIANEGERISENRLVELVQQLYPLLKPTVSLRQ